MGELPYSAGQFVWRNFPFSEAPSTPGPTSHIAYIIDIVERGEYRFIAVAGYSTTSPWPEARALPLGVIPIHEAAARRLGQRAFVLDLRRVAFIPIDRSYFPRIDNADRGVQGTATPQLQRKIETTIAQFVRRPELVELLGPARPRPAKPRRPGSK